MKRLLRNFYNELDRHRCSSEPFHAEVCLVFSFFLLYNTPYVMEAFSDKRSMSPNVMFSVLD